MTEPLRDCLARQFDTAWALAEFHLAGLTSEDCLWRPTSCGPHVRQTEDGMWVADWPVDEDYRAGPPNIAWIGWHMLFWWSMALDHSFGAGTLERDDVRWPGGAAGFRRELGRLERRWRAELAALDDAALKSTERVHWPFSNRPLSDVFAWANVELTKNAAEIGYLLFLRGAGRG